MPNSRNKNVSSNGKLSKSFVQKGGSFDPLDVTKSLGFQINRKIGRNVWSKDDDKKLTGLVQALLIEMGFPNGIKDIKSIEHSTDVSQQLNWDSLEAHFVEPRRRGKDLKKRWTASLDPNLKRGRWTDDEDKILLKAFQKHGPHWLIIAAEIPGRTEDQCAKRYTEVLGPNSKGRLREWSVEEDLLLISKVKQYGTKWRQISSEMECRPSLTCRNRWRKIITLVVRDKADPKISEAVRKHQELTKTNQNPPSNSPSPSQPQPQNNSNSMSNSITHEMPLPTRLLQQNTNLSISNKNTTPANSPPHLIRPLSVPLPMNASHVNNLMNNMNNNNIGRFHRPMMANSTGNSPIPMNALLSIRGLDNISTSSPSHNIHNNNSTQDNSHTNNKIENTFYHSHTQYASDGISCISNLNSFNNPNNKSSPEWTVTLKDSKEKTITQETLNNESIISSLVNEAKKHSLKIVINSHIHQHYCVHRDTNSLLPTSTNHSLEMNTNTHTNTISQNRTLMNTQSPSPSFMNIGEYSNNKSTDNSNALTSPNFHLTSPPTTSFSPGPSITYPLMIHPSFQDQNSNPYISFNSNTDDSKQYTLNNGREPLYERFGHSRKSHFNKLTTYLKPKLSSSGSSTPVNNSNPNNNSFPKNNNIHSPIGPNTSISQVINNTGSLDSPNNHLGFNNSQLNSNTELALKEQFNLRRPHISNNFNLLNMPFKSPTDTNASNGKHSVPSAEDDDGTDFWENLRNLAGQPTPDNPQFAPSALEEDYGIFFNFFDNEQRLANPGTQFYDGNKHISHGGSRYVHEQLYEEQESGDEDEEYEDEEEEEDITGYGS
ncbi:hypothetical protein TBLA_0E01770 [Henningerozyma blattae CBS 6284]|uniref:Myb-like DNA-binding protein BAS1 n=1 Tax=Henningerozyma blattae (strain ATCC 34711 / CBS 6284 / DSM 70876 / NBRC 10599 / NRRL Y-10934 / UCD 77-7) TaxID=1071380 RepID=I2H4D1_HENB6|nr:hypothetical protein TBLA_0E01770 [Tetrapisispora blattae CBS 6284]CCH61233.1 hypothetical protein TBLA_0E01770 [Tetrapisispora blattae CBS 6284]